VLARLLLLVWSTCYVNNGATNESVPTDSKGNTWHPTTRVRDSLLTAAQMYYTWGSGSGPMVGINHTFTFPACASGFGGSIFVVALSGTKILSDPLDQVAKCAVMGATQAVIPSFTPTVFGTAVVSAFAVYNSNTASVDNGLTITNHTESASWMDGSMADLIYGSMSAIQINWSISASASDGGGCAMAFDPPSGGSSFVVNQSVIVVGP
jgi:hypothetical protein